MSHVIQINIVVNAGQVGPVLQKLGAEAQGLGGKLQTLGPATTQAVTGFKNTGTAANQTGAYMTAFKDKTDKTSKSISGFGEKFAANRGLVFGIAGLSSALAEAAGMMGMLADTQQRAAEAQEKVNKLEEEGVTSGKAYADAQADVVKQNRFLNMVTRNTILSQMDMVFFSTMVVNAFINMGKEGGVLSGVLTKLKNPLGSLKTALSATTNNFGNFMSAMSPLPATLTATSSAGAKASTGITQIGTTSAISATKVLALSGALIGIGLAAFGIFELISAAERLKESLNQVFAEGIMKMSLFSAGFLQLKVMIGAASEAEKKAFADLQQATELTNQAMKNLGFTGLKAFMLSKEELELLNAEIVRLMKLSGEAGDIMSEAIKDPMSDLEAFNSTLQEMRDIQAAINPHVAEFKVMWNEVKPPVEDAGKLIKGFVANLDLAPPLAEELEADLNEWVKSISKSDKEAAKVLSKFEKIAQSVKLVNAVIATNEAKMLFKDESTFLGKTFSEKLEESKKTVRDFTSSANLLFKQFQNSVREDATLTAEEFIGAYKDLNPAIATIFMNLVDAAKDADKEVIDMFSNFESEAQNAYNEAAASASKWIDITGLVTPVLDNINAVLGDTVGRIDEQSNMIEDNATAWDRMTESSIKQTEANFNTIISWAKTNDMLSTNVEWQFKVKDAQVQGLVAAKEWTQQMLLEAKSAEQFRKNLINLNSASLENVDTNGMLTSEIQELATAMQGGSDAAIQLARDQNEAAISSLNFFDSLTGAKNKKDFNKAWKEFDLGSIPKRFKDDFKDMFKDLAPIHEKANEVATALRGVNVALQFKQDEVGKTAISGTLKEITKDLGEIAKVDVGSAMIKEKLIDPINSLNSKSAKRDALKEIPQTIEGIATALDDGSISLAEYNELMMKNAIETQNFNNLTPQQISYLESIGINTGKAAEGTKQFTEEMAKIEAAAIVTTTIAEMWAIMGQEINRVNGLINDSWILIMQQILIATTLTSIDIITTFETDIPTAVEASITALSDMAIAMLGLIAIMNGTGGAGGNGANKFSFENIFGNEKGPGDIPSQPPATGGGNDPFGQKGFEQLTIGEGENGEGGEGGGLLAQWQTMLTGLVTATQEAVAEIITLLLTINTAWAEIIAGMIESNLVLQESWSETNINMASMFATTGIEITKFWGTVILEMDEIMDIFVQAYTDGLGEMIDDSAIAFQGIFDMFSTAMDEIISKAEDMLSNWEGVMDDMVSAAEDAAADIQSAMDGIKDTESVHTIRTVHVGGIATGGVLGFAEGGTISAQQGLTTSNGPAVIYGDNSGGRETLAFLPHDGHKADAIMDSLDTMFGRKKNVNIINAGGERDITVPITININGEQFSFTRKYRIRQGQDLAQQVF